MSNQAPPTIAGRYRLISKIGEGGMGSVWRAEHLTLGSDVAIKLIEPTYAENQEIRARFMREAQAAAQLRSPHVVQIFDYGVDGETPFIAMELMEGESLADRLRERARLSPAETSRIVTEVARALGKAHEAGIIHRDLKPDNIFLVKNDDAEIAKVLDFGIAKKTSFGAEGAGMTSTGAVLGTPYYMSPEQAEGLKDLDHRTDIWSLAVIAYECILGVRPFGGETLGGVFLSICTRPKPVPSLVATVPTGFDVWFEKGTARLLADRFATAREAALALREICEPGRTTSSESRELAERPVGSHEKTIASSSPGSTEESLAQSSTNVAPIPALPEFDFKQGKGPPGLNPPALNPPALGLSTAGVGAVSVPAVIPTKSTPGWVWGIGGVAALALVIVWQFSSPSGDESSTAADPAIADPSTGAEKPLEVEAPDIPTLKQQSSKEVAAEKTETAPTKTETPAKPEATKPEVAAKPEIPAKVTSPSSLAQAAPQPTTTPSKPATKPAQPAVKPAQAAPKTPDTQKKSGSSPVNLGI